MRHLYLSLQACAFFMLAAAFIWALTELGGSRDDISALPQYSAGGLTLAQWNAKTADMLSFEAQKSFSWKAYDFAEGKKVPVFPDGAFAKDPFVNPPGTDTGYFVSEKDAQNAELLNAWLESLCARIEGMKLAGISPGMGCVFLRDGKNFSSHWATKSRPLMFDVPEPVLKALKESNPECVRKEKILIFATKIGESGAEFLMPVLKRVIAKTWENRGDGAEQIICEPYRSEAPQN